MQMELQYYSISCISSARPREEFCSQESQDGLPEAITNISYVSYAGNINKLRAYQVKNHVQDIQVQTIDHISLVTISGCVSRPANNETSRNRRAHLEN
jgi:hypothetical protein